MQRSAVSRTGAAFSVSCATTTLQGQAKGGLPFSFTDAICMRVEQLPQFGQAIEDVR